MKDIKSCLEKQIEVSKELNHILTTLDKIEEKERELLYEENKKLLNSLTNYNEENVTLTNDRVLALQERVLSLLNNENTNKDPNFKEYLLKFNKELDSLQYKVKYLEDNLANMNEKHNEFIQNTTHTSKQNASRLINTSKPVNTKPTIKKQQQFEFNVGANMLNIIGVILILIAFITFGSYVYTNYLNETLKGICLFIIAGATLLIGDKVLSKKIPKFGLGISALGLCGLSASININYVYLETINYFFATILTVVLLAFGIYYSKKKNSNILRMIVITQGYACAYMLFERDSLTQIVTFIILLSVIGSNIFIPIKRKNFVMYSTILIGFYSNVYNFRGLTEVLFLGLVLICISFMNIISKEDNNKNRLALFLISLYFLLSTGCEGTIYILIIYLIISIISYVLCNNGLKNMFVINSVIVMLIILDKYTVGTMYDLLLILTILTTAFVTIKEKDICLKITLLFISLIGLFHLIDYDKALDIILYILVFSVLIFKLSMEDKNSRLSIALKNLFFVSLILLIGNITMNSIVIKLEMGNTLMAITSIAYVLLINKVEVLKDKYVNTSNKIILILAFLINQSIFNNSVLFALLMLMVSSLILLLLTNINYVQSDFIQKHKVLIFSIFSTYGFILLIESTNIQLDIINILMSIGLMILAFINVWIGLKLEKLEVRKYGLILSFIICAKLIFVDFYSFNFVIKTILFLVVGVVALLISYTYSKLEQELKNKDK